MKKLFSILILTAVLFSTPSLFAQIEITLDNTGPECTIIGNWTERATDDAFGSTILYTAKGDGSAKVIWEKGLTWPGQYEIEFHNINGGYAPDAPCTIRTTTGDTIVEVNQKYNPGWQSLGVFDLPETCKVALSNAYQGSARFVMADAIRLTAAMETYFIKGKVSFNDNNKKIPAKIELSKSGANETLDSKYLLPDNRTFSIEIAAGGWYDLTCSAWGYDTLTVDSIHVSGSDVTGLNLVMNPSPLSRHQISGTVFLDDENDSSVCRVELYARNYPIPYPVSFDSVNHLESYYFQNVPDGEYCLKFFAKHYHPDTTSLTSVMIADSDVELEQIVLYSFFKFAWITDSHIGVGFTENDFEQEIRNINEMKDQIDFVIHTGDLTEKGLDHELEQYKNMIDKCKIPVWSMPGNHDTKWTESGLETIEQIFGSTHFSFSHQGFQFIGINSGIPLRGGGGYFDPAQINWLKDELSNMSDPDRPVIIGWHHPGDFGSIYNYWQVLDLLKQYKTNFIMVGHGHSNRKYNYEGIPGAMSLATYGNNAGFNVVCVSRKNITVTTHYLDGSVGAPWIEQSFIDERQPQIQFTNLSEHELVSGTKSIQVHTSEPVTNGKWNVRYGDLSGNLSGNGQDWSVNLNTELFKNGYHTLNVSFTSSGKRICRTRGFVVENGYPKGLWRFDAQAEIITKPAFDQNNVYVGTSDGKIMALKLEDGTPAWDPIQTQRAVFSSPTVHEDRLYAGASDGNLYAVDVSDGTTAWTFPTGKAILTPPVVADSLIYFGSGHRFYAVSLNNHEEIWHYQVDGMMESKPIIAGNKIIFGCWDRCVYCLDRFTGSKNWSWVRASSFYYAPGACWPALGSGRVFVTDPQRYVSAINLINGQTIWSDNSPEAWESVGISEEQSRVYMRSLDGSLYAFSGTENSQQQLWRSRVGYGWDSTPSMPVEKNGSVFTGSKKGFVCAVNAEKGNQLWKYWVGHAYITTVTPIDGFRVLAAGLDGTVTLIEGDPALPVHSDNDQSNIPLKNELYPPYPNPFNHSVSIKYTIKTDQRIDISIYNILGEEVYSFPASKKEQGEYQLVWDGKNNAGQNLSSGMYIVSLKGELFEAKHKIMFIK